MKFNKLQGIYSLDRLSKLLFDICLNFRRPLGAVVTHAKRAISDSARKIMHVVRQTEACMSLCMCCAFAGICRQHMIL